MEIIQNITGLGDYDNVILSDYDKGMFQAPEQIIEYANSQGKPVLVDPKFKSFSAYRGAAVIKPNKLELEHEVGAWLSVGDVVDHVRCAIPEYLIHPFDPEIPGLIDV